MKLITVLGSTGSIGRSTLDVVRQRRHEVGVYALVAGRNIEKLAQQIVEFRPAVAVVAEEASIKPLVVLLEQAGMTSSTRPDLAWGEPSYLAAAIAPEVDFLMSAIVGVAGLEATYQALRARKRVGLANKETLVAGGRLIMDAVRECSSELIPVDSEHNAAHQCLRAGRRSEVRKLILTASGGPFRTTPLEKLAHVTPAEALQHPTWKMGPRITIDSATLMNKGFEVIEACWLFGFAPRDVEVVVHPQSTVHALVEYNDGSVIAQVCATDMRMPIQYAMTWPDREPAPVPRLDWTATRHWDFEAPDFSRFPLLSLAYHAQEAGGSSGCTLNAADEVAVEAFLRGQIPFPAIAAVVEDTLSVMPFREATSIHDLLDIDRRSRSAAAEAVRRRAGRRATAALT
ncbi:MAG: 1-deoxy-D-xylulose-5-phosphate reductoisomerase [Bryobacteraceae bacterium]